jgi:hypothetical protein
MADHLSLGSLTEPLTAIVRREAPSATLHLNQGDDQYWCTSWRINDRTDRELFVEYPGRSVAPDVLRIGVYFRDAPDATAADTNRTAALEALTTRRHALAALGVACTFTAGSATRDDESFAWRTPDLVRWLTTSCANRDLVWRWDLRAGPPPADHIQSVVQGVAPVWRIWNAL